MPDYDVLVRGADPLPAIGISGGRVAGFVEAPAREVIEASGLVLLPGVVDAHVHFNEPGRTDWEGWASGSRAAAAGGVTTVCDMPLNSHPPVVSPAAFLAKRAAAEARSICDFALWGGLIPGSVDALEPLAALGAIGFKAFMCPSGIAEFPAADTATLRAGMRRAAALGLPVAVHAELEGGGSLPHAGSRSPAEANRPAPPPPGTRIADYLASRPIESECAAIRLAIELAGEAGCALHVVHVSSARGVAIVADARARGADVTAETCPHYLVFTAEDLEQLGAVAKCAPPLRPAGERAALLALVRAGQVQTLGSDHSPAPWTMKVHDDFFAVWGGIAGIQHLLPLVLDLGLDPGLVAGLTAGHAAQRFRLPGKGSLELGSDADLTLVELGGAHEVTAESLLYRHPVSPYVGRLLRARVRRTLRRGETVYRDGLITADGGGRFLAPS